MDIVNHTPFPSQAFTAVDQHDQQFDIFVLRQTLSYATGQLEYADVQAPLCIADQAFEGPVANGTRQESDFCPWKPRCDVIVNASAYAPGGRAVATFLVRVRVARGDIASHPFLIDKTLRVHGERCFKKKIWPVRLLQWLLTWGTLTSLRPNPWRLTRAKPMIGLPLRDRFCYGGQCRVELSHGAARKVPSDYVLTPAQRARHPDGEPAAPVAHTVCETNPSGTGYAPAWYLKARRISMVPAPRIEANGKEITVSQFWRSITPSTKKSPDMAPAGFGLRPKVHPARRILLGKIDSEFIQSELHLPRDFDFGIWNAAHPDQQIDFPQGGETIELANLCPADSPGATVNARGHSFLQLILPKHRCFVLLGMADETFSTLQLQIDTIIVDSDDQLLTLVWRAAHARDSALPVVAAQFRMRAVNDPARFQFLSAFQYPLNEALAQSRPYG